MPIPLLTPQILASTKPLLDGWSLVTLISVRNEPKNNSVNYWFDFSVEAGPGNTTDNAGKKTAFLVSGNGLAQGIPSLCSAYQQMLSAFTGMSGEALANKEIDEQSLVGSKAWVKIGHRIADGKEYPDFIQFSPPNEVPF